MILPGNKLSLFVHGCAQHTVFLLKANYHVVPELHMCGINAFGL